MLGSPITADVVIPLATTDPTEGTVAPGQLAITPGNWSAVQTATVTGLSDTIADGDVVHAVTVGPAISADISYNGLSAPDIEVTNLEP